MIEMDRETLRQILRYIINCIDAQAQLHREYHLLTVALDTNDESKEDLEKAMFFVSLFEERSNAIVETIAHELDTARQYLRFILEASKN